MRDGEGVGGVVGERGVGRDGEGGVVDCGGDGRGVAVGEGDGRVVRSGLDRLIEGDADGCGAREAVAVVGGVDRGDDEGPRSTLHGHADDFARGDAVGGAA